VRTLHRAYKLEEAQKWKSAVQLFDNPDISYLPEYCRIFELEGWGTACLFFYQDEGESAIYPFFLRSINNLPGFQHLDKSFYDISSPYGYGGPLFSSFQEPFLKGFEKCFQGFCREMNVVTEFVRFHPLLENHLPLRNSYLDIEKVKPVVILDLGQTEAEIWAGYKYSNRKNIKKARRSGLEVLFEEHPQHFPQFFDIYRDTMARRNARSFYRFSEKFFWEIHKTLQNNYIYAHVLKDGKVISTELLLYNRRFIHSFLGGTFPEYYPLRPNNLLKHEIILWAQNKGMRYFILGGGYKETDGIFEYKCAFSPTGIRDFFVGKGIHNYETFKFLEETGIKQKRVNPGTRYFPSYRSEYSSEGVDDL